jgi:mannose-6-phosphate isomerase
MSAAGPLLFDPILKRIRWGGRRLGTVLGKNLGPHADYAESWEIADMGPVQSTVATGPLRGQTLASLIASQPQFLLGSPPAVTSTAGGAPPSSQFPLLVKFLDASDRLSLQVHPDDAQAQRAGVGPRGKTEAWIVLETEPNATLFAGLQPGVTRAQFETAVRSGAVEPLLHRVAVRPGDCLFIPAGTVHALGEGVLLAEVQQSSDTTYRLFDWNRVDASGQPRELHIEAGLDCVDFDRGPVQPVTPRAIPHPALSPSKAPSTAPASSPTAAGSCVCHELVQSPQFQLRRIEGSGRLAFAPTGEWSIWIVTHGEIRCLDVPPAELPPGRPGTTWFWPADRRVVQLELAPGTCLIEATCG